MLKTSTRRLLYIDAARDRASCLKRPNAHSEIKKNFSVKFTPRVSLFVFPFLLTYGNVCMKDLQILGKVPPENCAFSGRSVKNINFVLLDFSRTSVSFPEYFSGTGFFSIR